MVTRPADRALADRLMAREEAALEQVIDLYGGLVFGIAKRVLADPTLAEEVSQDAFLALWRRPGAFDPERGSLKTFLGMLARNKAVDLVRHEESLRRRADALIHEMGVETAGARFDEVVEGRSEITSAVAQLSDVQREAIALAYFGGRTYREVASELGIAEGTAKTRLRDGLLKLRAAMTEARAEGDDD